MNKKYFNIKDLLYKYSKFGLETTENGTILVGHPDYLLELWWLVKIFPKLNEEDIKTIEDECSMSIPEQYKDFLTNFANGFSFQNGVLSLFGLRKISGRTLEASRQPFSLTTPNKMERKCIRNVKDSFFFIGSYKFDGSLLYIDETDQKVYLCKRDDANPLYSWNGLCEMINSELTRLYTYYTEDGHKIDKTKSTLPI